MEWGQESRPEASGSVKPNFNKFGGPWQADTSGTAFYRRGPRSTLRQRDWIPL